MRAAVFHGNHDIRIEDVPDPRIEQPTDAIVRITRTAVCGSDLWFYRGQQDYEPGSRTGHEPMGIVEEVGSEVTGVKRGDLVLAPFAIGLIADYAALSGSLVAYAVSTIVCAGMTLASRAEPFDFDVIARRTGDFDPEGEPAETTPVADSDDEPVTV